MSNFKSTVNKVKINTQKNPLNTAGHIPRKISRCVYFFIKQESGRVYETLKSLKYEATIFSGGLEIPRLLKLDCQT